ncbi:MAG: VOC family protein [Geitlerinemataceae cyanobacterium]|mgnify:CR=1 FL=1
MGNYRAVEIKAFVPAKDFELCKQFYADLGFELKSSDGEMAYFAAGNTSFMLQNFYRQEHAENFMMHLLVESADDWWQRAYDRDLEARYGVRLSAPADRDWRMRDFTLSDPTGVLWRIGHNLDS